MGLYSLIRYHVVPPLFVFFFTLVTQLLVFLGGEESHFRKSSVLCLGSSESWAIVLLFMAWTFLSLKVPSKIFLGPPTPVGYVPKYSANGVQFYLSSLLVYLLLVFNRPEIPLLIHSKFSEIISLLNLFSLILCVLLLVKGHLSPEVVEGARDKPLPYQFYAGIELHPRLLGVDIKQWTNCRFGMMGWALLVLNFGIASLQKNGFHLGPFVNAALINIYLLKFFYWETGYFNTLDITLDRAGYYLCWGCLTWVQVFYTFSAYWLVSNPSVGSHTGCIAIFILGLLAIWLNYSTDRQKELFKESNGDCIIWGRKAEFIPVQYLDKNGKKIKSRLLLSGFWGFSRHLNYVWELLLALAWSLPSVGQGSLLPFMYPVFLLILLVHRTFRDEEKCALKYGEGWTEYCKRVPYRMIPFVF